MLSLVVSDRHLVRAVHEDVPGHENGIVQQAGRNTLLPYGLVFVLRHAFQPANGGNAIEYPAALGVRRHVALDEECALVGVNAAGEQCRRQLPRLPAQVVGFDFNGNGVEVHDAEEILLRVLVLDPLLERADVVAELRVPARLNPAEDALSGNSVNHAFYFFLYLSSHVSLFWIERRVPFAQYEL